MKERKGEIWMGLDSFRPRAVRRAKWKLLGIPAAITSPKPPAAPKPPEASGTSGA